MDLEFMREERLRRIEELEKELKEVIQRQQVVLRKYWETARDGKPDLLLGQEARGFSEKMDSIADRVRTEKLRIILIDDLIAEKDAKGAL